MKFLILLIVLLTCCPVFAQSAGGAGPDQSLSPGGVPQVVASPSAGAILTSNFARYRTGENVRLEFLVTNHSKGTVKYEFSSAQEFDVIVTDSSNQEVWTWSKSKVFNPLITNLLLAPTQSREYDIVWRQRDDSDHLVPPGTYTATATLIPMARPMVSGNFLQSLNNDPTNSGIPMDNIQSGAVRIKNTTPQVYARTAIIIVQTATSPGK
jgi:hypothetical protein